LSRSGIDTFDLIQLGFGHGILQKVTKAQLARPKVKGCGDERVMSTW
jgi:hypothetical protein